MRSIHDGRGVRLVFVAALAAFAVGCGADGGAELGKTQEALSWGSWGLIPNVPPPGSGPLAEVYGVSLVTKKHFRFSAFVTPYDNVLWQNTNGGLGFAGWTTLTGGTSTTSMSSKVTGTSWLGSGGVDASKNLLLAYLHYNPSTFNMDVKFGWSAESEGMGTVYTWTSLAGTGATGQPALAYANGWVYLFIQKSSDNKIYFKKNNVASGYNTANWSAGWTGPVGSSTMAGGVSAAASGSDTITVAAAPFDGGPSCLVNAVTASTGAVSATGAWRTVTNCSHSAYSTPGLAATGSNGTGAARMVVWKSGSPDSLATATGSGTSSTWSSFTSLPSGCVPVTNPAVVQWKSSGEIVFATTCSGSSGQGSWITMTP